VSSYANFALSINVGFIIRLLHQWTQYSDWLVVLNYIRQMSPFHFVEHWECIECRARIWPTALRQLPWWPLSFAVVPPQIGLCPRPKVAVGALPVCRSALPMPDTNCIPNMCIHGDTYQISHRQAVMHHRQTFQYMRISSKYHRKLVTTCILAPLCLDFSRQALLHAYA